MSSTIFKEGQGDGKPTGKPGLKGGEAAAGASKGRRDRGGSLRGVAEREGTAAGQAQGRGAVLRPGQAAGWRCVLCVFMAGWAGSWPDSSFGGGQSLLEEMQAEAESPAPLKEPKRLELQGPSLSETLHQGSGCT